MVRQSKKPFALSGQIVRDLSRTWDPLDTSRVVSFDSPKYMLTHYRAPMACKAHLSSSRTRETRWRASSCSTSSCGSAARAAYRDDDTRALCVGRPPQTPRLLPRARARCLLGPPFNPHQLLQLRGGAHSLPQQLCARAPHKHAAPAVVDELRRRSRRPWLTQTASGTVQLTDVGRERGYGTERGRG
jgi:hypothetical protein